MLDKKQKQKFDQGLFMILGRTFDEVFDEYTCKKCGKWFAKVKGAPVEDFCRDCRKKEGVNAKSSLPR